MHHRDEAAWRSLASESDQLEGDVGADLREAALLRANGRVAPRSDVIAFQLRRCLRFCPLDGGVVTSALPPRT